MSNCSHLATIIFMHRIGKYRCANGRVPFDEWFNSIKDIKVRARLLKRLDKILLGNLGEWRSLGGGVYELKEHFNRGFRIYYGMENQTLILLLCGGDKSSQVRDIKKAKQYWQEYKEGHK